MSHEREIEKRTFETYQHFEKYIHDETKPEFMIDMYKESPDWQNPDTLGMWMYLSETVKKRILDDELDEYFMNHC